MNNSTFINDCYYHVYNRGVEKRTIFLDHSDCYRFIHDLFEFNDTASAGKYSEVKPPQDIKRELIVDIVCFCLMPNHFHLILKQRVKGGISFFMKKLGTGYSMYFNKKYKRVGSLYQGCFKSKYIENDEYLIHLSRYIHLNPLEIIEKGWKSEGIKDWKKAKTFLNNYKFSSFLDYSGKKNLPSILTMDFLKNFIEDNRMDYKKFIFNYIAGDYHQISQVSID